MRLSRPTARLPDALVDAATLAAVAGLSVGLYTARLGFYSDDWVYFGLLETGSERSLWGLFGGLYSDDPVIRQRPVQVAYITSMYRLFGLEPLPYHVVNAVALLVAALLLYALLRELRQPRLLALAVPSIYLTMPNFSTDRFWVAAHQATLAIVFLLVGTYAVVRAVRARPLAFAALTVVGAFAFILSGMAYEVTIPLVVAAAALAAWQARQLPEAEFGDEPVRRLRVLLPAILAALAAVVVFKAVESVRIGSDQSYLEYARTVVTGVVRVNLGVYGVGLPYVLFWIVRHALDPAVLALGVLAGALVALALAVVGADARERERAVGRGRQYVIAGALVFVLGYAVFVVQTDVWFTSTSLGNRIGIAAALGVAGMLAGAAAWIASALTARSGRAFFAVAVGTLCASGVVVTNTLARFWESAYREQQRVLSDMWEHLPPLRAGSVVIIDGVCPERGGAYLFTGKRDVTGLLSVQYDTRSLRGSAVTNPPRLSRDGVVLETFRSPDVFAYGAGLVVYNAERRESRRLTTARAAEDYFSRAAFDPRRDCLSGFAWRGPKPPTD